VVRRLPLRRMVEGAAIGIALWCMLLAFQLLAGKTADSPGVLMFGLAGIAIRMSPLGDALLPLLAVAAAIVVAVTQTPLSDAVASRWIRTDAFPDSGVAAVVVLSAAVNANETISSEALDHLITGLELTGAGKAPVLVTTTVRQFYPGGAVSSETDQSRIVALFGRQVRWIRTRPGRSTRDEAVNAAKLLLPHGSTRIAVVASPMHTRRACSAFEAVGFLVTCVPARSRASGGVSPASPQDRLVVFGNWVYEVTGTAKYRMRGWLAARPARNSNTMASKHVRLQAPVAPVLHTW
jgi:uncharacterized SAM-binding protein YcdF (DUF218 family)